VSTIIQDLRFAYRTLRKGWWVSALAVVSLAVAIGGNTAVFSLINALIFRPLPYAEPDRIVIFQEREHSTPPSLGNFLTSLPVYADLSERSQTTTDAAVFSPGTFRLQGAERVQTVGGARVTQGFFETLGVDARRGRVFLPEEGVEGGPRVVVLTHEYSERTGGAEEDPIGTVMILDGEPHEVVGVLPPGFDFLVANVDVWVPLTRSPRSAPRTRRNIITLARMTPTATMEQVRIEAKALGEQFAAEYPQVQSDWAVDAFNLRHDLPTGRSRTLMALLQATVLSVLLIACLNITNLLLARSQDRKQELAIRVALGAGQGRLVRQILTESSLLAVTGALGGIGLGWWGIRLISTELASRLPPTWSPVLDVRVLAFTLGISVLASLAFGLAPALGAGRAAPSEQLKEGGVRTTGPGRRQWMGKALVVGEIALCLLALGGGGLLMSGLRELQNPDAGFEQEGILTAQVTLPEEVFIYGGRSILRAGTRLDFVKHGDAFRQCVDNWLHELIQQDRLPAVNPKAGNGLGAELLYQLLAAATGRREFGVRLLKCDDTGRNYEPVGKDLGSGGEALTTAVLLYALLISMRSRRRQRTDDRIPAFLLLDNPLGVCNRSDFLDAQLKVARAMGIQCVYLTGINDRESLDLFELRVAIRKGQRRLAIDGSTYECLEVTQLHLERGHA